MSEQKETTIFVDGMNLILKYSPFEDAIDMDDLTRIHYENLYGEAVTVSAIQNRIGILKAEAEAAYERKKLECDIYEANLRNLV
jgi:hypothetical protein